MFVVARYIHSLQHSVAHIFAVRQVLTEFSGRATECWRGEERGAGATGPRGSRNKPPADAVRAACHRTVSGGGNDSRPTQPNWSLKMDKKDLAAIVTNLVEAVQREQNVPEGMARALVGFALMKNTEALVASIKNPAGAVPG